MSGATPGTDHEFPAQTDQHAPTDRGPTPGRSVTRRVAIGGGLAVTGALAAACTVGGSDQPADGSAASGVADADADGGLVALDEVPVGEAVAVTIDGMPAVVARPAEDAVAAFSARCTHRGCTVRVDGAVLKCPCHGSQFDALTGAVLRGPADRPLTEIAVRLDGDEVVQA